ncbi:hypothetical protein SAMN05444959_110107 [Paracoccus seriniphilus]|uniref:Transposase n=1 Tax=Paracoccus seriniphilus TaxID=184748 RepID=A0A239PZE1_9RHOB|nr:hypothetical protein SAMN05444959_110107 [Paracoccus seriniphilus]
MVPKHSDDFKREAVRIATSNGLTRRIWGSAFRPCVNG